MSHWKSRNSQLSTCLPIDWGLIKDPVNMVPGPKWQKKPSLRSQKDQSIQTRKINTFQPTIKGMKLRIYVPFCVIVILNMLPCWETMTTFCNYDFHKIFNRSFGLRPVTPSILAGGDTQAYRVSGETGLEESKRQKERCPPTRSCVAQLHPPPKEELWDANTERPRPEHDCKALHQEKPPLQGENITQHFLIIYNSHPPTAFHFM